MDNIKFGTDGWRSVIADGFTVGNLARIARASSRWLVNQQKDTPHSVIIGYDTRFGGQMFAETTAKIFVLAGIKVYLSDRFVSTPMVSYGVIHKNASLGVVITASHNPYNYNGFKLKGHYGGPLLDTDIKNIENMVPESNEVHLDSLNLNDYIEKGNIEYINLERIYLQHVRANFDLDSIEKSGFVFAFDAMYGSGQQVIKELLPGAHLMHCQHDFTFGGVSPEPSGTNLQEFSSYIRKNGKIDCGLAVDGDADRVALIDENGNYIDSHNVILLLIHYLHKYKGCDGKVVAGFSSTARIEKLCKHYGLEVQRVRIGFKEVCSIMLKEKVLVGGEESGGISVFSHMPDRDGIWMGLLIWQFMVETGKSLRELIGEVHSITGSFAYERSDLQLDKSMKSAVMEKCKKGFFRKFGDRTVERVETLDGFKFFFNEGEWFMIRSSGTGPVLRTYAESGSRESALEILKAGRELIFSTKQI
jgi:phosphomannomutase